ncbi:MAG TPA: hypothetical protein VIX73_23095 [Kofleriaceae bacterium]|jgi:DNA-directed RNA polymerase subunit RPC12/RpoP
MAPKCICCGDEMEVVRTKSNKPYVKCDACGFQGFVRGRKGIEKFTGKYGAGWKDEAARSEPKAEPPAPAKKAAAAPAGKKSSDDIMEFGE